MNELLALKYVRVREIFMPRIHDVANVVCIWNIASRVCIWSEGSATPTLFTHVRDQAIIIQDFAEITTIRPVYLLSLKQTDVLSVVRPKAIVGDPSK